MLDTITLFLQNSKDWAISQFILIKKIINVEISNEILLALLLLSLITLVLLLRILKQSKKSKNTPINTTKPDDKKIKISDKFKKSVGDVDLNLSSSETKSNDSNEEEFKEAFGGAVLNLGENQATSATKNEILSESADPEELKNLKTLLSTDEFKQSFNAAGNKTEDVNIAQPTKHDMTPTDKKEAELKNKKAMQDIDQNKNTDVNTQSDTDNKDSDEETENAKNIAALDELLEGNFIDKKQYDAKLEQLKK